MLTRLPSEQAGPHADVTPTGVRKGRLNTQKDH